MTHPHNLDRIQRWFWKSISAPPVEDQNGEVQPVEDGSRPLSKWIASDSEDMAEERLQVYANMYFFRIRDVLMDFFEKAYLAIGRQHFNDLVIDYLPNYPSDNASLFHIGGQLAEYTKTHSLGQTYPWLPELLRFERLRTNVITMEDTPVLTEASLKAYPPEQWGELSFEPIKALYFESFAYPIHIPWKRVEEKDDELSEDERPTLDPKPTPIVIWRMTFNSAFYVMGENEAKAFSLLLEGKTFNEICEAFVPADMSEEPSAEDIQAIVQEAYHALSRWLTNGLLSKINAPNA